MLVDDEPYNIMGLKIILIQTDYPAIPQIIDHAFIGQEALNKVKLAFNSGYCYGLIFMDASMPVLDGYQATDAIREFMRNNNIL